MILLYKSGLSGMMIIFPKMVHCAAEFGRMEKKKKFSKSVKKGLTSAFLYGIMFTEQNERGLHHE